MPHYSLPCWGENPFCFFSELDFIIQALRLLLTLQASYWGRTHLRKDLIPVFSELLFFTFNSTPSKTFAEKCYPSAVDNLANSPFLNVWCYCDHQPQKSSESEYCNADIVFMLCPKSSESRRMGKGIHRPLYQSGGGSADPNVPLPPPGNSFSLSIDN